MPSFATIWPWLIATAGVLTPNADDPSGVAFFESKIRPVLVERCQSCHSVESKHSKGGLRVDDREALRIGGDSGPAVVPGKADESLLLKAIAHDDDVTAMPPSPKPKLDDAILADFRRWIDLGAPDPREPGSPTVSAASINDDWWSLKPIVATAPPSDSTGWAKSPIDAFVLEKLTAKGLKPSPEADRRTLLRRLSFDLIGLPPSLEEINAFVNDTNPDAYERQVDRLLASPHYGERWARHWMDVVHFAETHGHDQDRVRPNAWPYRDYLIESFNRDTPYPRFIREQLAADAFFPGEPAKVVALGMIAAGPWDESSLRDIREDTIDRAFGRYLDRDDMINTVMSTFVSLTVGCARCHDHKFDPISQADYYNLQAVFAGTDRGDRPYDPDPELARKRKDLLAKRDALNRRDPAFLATLSRPETLSEVAAWEAQLKAKPTVWNVLDPETVTSEGGATLTEESDHAILSSGTKPTKEVVKVRIKTSGSPITGIRLEVLPDDRLPSKGPGRNPNGNLHLTEFEVDARPASKPDAPPKRLAIAKATADFDQTDWGIAGAIDGKESTAWGIFPEVGKPHQAVFELSEDLVHDGETWLTVTLKQVYPVDHPIGKFRLSATSAPRPVGIAIHPETIATILSVPAESRNAEQSRELAAYVVGKSLDAQIQALPPRQLVYSGTNEFAPDGTHRPAAVPRPVHLLKRGDIHAPGPLSAPASLTCAKTPTSFQLAADAPESQRREALARWLSDAENPLVWRSIVNRVWHYHFGRGIVDTPNDFGRMGSPPSHPELLDWLAADFRDSGGSFKAMHRRIVTSATYRQASTQNEAAAKLDADNRLLWRQNRRRLDAEAVHDAVLMASGQLDRAKGGPSVRQFELRPGVHVTPVVDYSKFTGNEPGANRRAVYRFLFRTLPDPFFDTLDAADASQLTAARNESLTPLQALALLHNRFMLRQSKALAERVEKTSKGDENRVRTLFEYVLGRAPDANELADWLPYEQKHGTANMGRLLMNSSEFLFVD